MNIDKMSLAEFALVLFVSGCFLLYTDSLGVKVERRKASYEPGYDQGTDGCDHFCTTLLVSLEAAEMVTKGVVSVAKGDIGVLDVMTSASSSVLAFAGWVLGPLINTAATFLGIFFNQSCQVFGRNVCAAFI
jgi:hypothetical protein